MRPLFEITRDFQDVDAILDQADLDESAQLALNDQLERLLAEAGEKLDNYLAYMDQLQMEEAAARDMSDHWETKANAIARKSHHLKERIREHMKARGIKKIVSATGRCVSLVGNGGVAPIYLDPIEISQIPEPFVKTAKIPNNDAIRRALEAGEKLSFARLGERGTHVRIT